MSTKRTAEDRQELLEGLRRAGQELGTLEVIFHSLIANRAGLGATDHKALLFLSEAGAMTAGELAARTGLTTGSVTALIDRLEAKGYARRVSDPSDRRRVLVEPNVDEARRQIAPLFENLGRRLSDLYAGYSTKELELILAYKSRLNEVLREAVQGLRLDSGG
jgi:DNA-binding MarR family transcriptional regulator